jgi:predicted alpha/beta-hydrolase family hydrolase
VAEKSEGTASENKEDVPDKNTPKQELVPDSVPTDSKPISCLRSPSCASLLPSLIFTHGAGGGLSAPATMNFARGYATTGSPIVCFQGSMNLKARTNMFATVLAHYENNSEQLESTSKIVAFGGRSMGARAAVLAAQETDDVNLLVLVSYPLVGPKGDVRDKILLDIRPDVHVLFISGDRDSMCDLALLAKVRAKMKAESWMVTVKGTDHGMNLAGGAKLKQASEEVVMETGSLAARWIDNRESSHKDVLMRWDEDRGTVVIDDGEQEDGADAEEAGADVRGKAATKPSKKSRSEEKDDSGPGKARPKRRRTKR